MAAAAGGSFSNGAANGHTGTDSVMSGLNSAQQTVSTSGCWTRGCSQPIRRESEEVLSRVFDIDPTLLQIHV